MGSSFRFDEIPGSNGGRWKVRRRKLSWRTDSNRRPAAYKAAALPAELRQPAASRPREAQPPRRGRDLIGRQRGGVNCPARAPSDRSRQRWSQRPSSFDWYERPCLGERVPLPWARRGSAHGAAEERIASHGVRAPTRRDVPALRPGRSPGGAVAKVRPERHGPGRDLRSGQRLSGAHGGAHHQHLHPGGGPHGGAVSRPVHGGWQAEPARGQHVADHRLGQLVGGLRRPVHHSRAVPVGTEPAPGADHDPGHGRRRPGHFGHDSAAALPHRAGARAPAVPGGHGLRRGSRGVGRKGQAGHQCVLGPGPRRPVEASHQRPAGRPRHLRRQLGQVRRGLQGVAGSHRRGLHPGSAGRRRHGGRRGAVGLRDHPGHRLVGGGPGRSFVSGDRDPAARHVAEGHLGPLRALHRRRGRGGGGAHDPDPIAPRHVGIVPAGDRPVPQARRRQRAGHTAHRSRPAPGMGRRRGSRWWCWSWRSRRGRWA